MQSTFASGAAALLYLSSGALLGIRLSRGRRGRDWPRLWPLLPAMLGLLLHSAVLYGQVFVGDGLNLGFFVAISLFGWLIAALLIAACSAQPVENLGIVLLPASAVAVLLALLFPTERMIYPEHRALRFHILLSVLAYAVLAMAAVQALLLAVQDRHLRRHRPGGFVRGLPPLITMEQLLFQMIGIGFVLLTFALITGSHFLSDIFAQRLAHKTVLSLLAWLVFAVLLWGRWRHGWRGRTAIRGTLAGFAVLLLAYFGSKLVLELVLQRV